MVTLHSSHREEGQSNPPHSRFSGDVLLLQYLCSLPGTLQLSSAAGLLFSNLAEGCESFRWISAAGVGRHRRFVTSFRYEVVRDVLGEENGTKRIDLVRPQDVLGTMQDAGVYRQM